jgi:hypothetical protein
VANALAFAKSGHITSLSLLATVLSRFNNLSITLRDTGLSTLALLGSLFQQGIETHRMLAHVIIDPSNEDFDFEQETVGLPVRSALKRALNLVTVLNGNAIIDDFSYPYSEEDTRDEIFGEYESEFSTVLLQTALKKITGLYENQDVRLRRGALNLVMGPFATDISLPDYNDMPKDLQLLLIQLENFFNHLIDQDNAKMNPETLHDEVYDLLYKHAKYNHVKFRDAMSLLERVERMEFLYSFDPPAQPGKTVIENTPILSVMRNMVNFTKVKAIINPLNFLDPNLVLKEYT